MYSNKLCWSWMQIMKLNGMHIKHLQAVECTMVELEFFALLVSQSWPVSLWERGCNHIESVPVCVNLHGLMGLKRKYRTGLWVLTNLDIILPTSFSSAIDTRQIISNLMRQYLWDLRSVAETVGAERRQMEGKTDLWDLRSVAETVGAERRQMEGKTAEKKKSTSEVSRQKKRQWVMRKKENKQSNRIAIDRYIGSSQIV